MLHPTDSTVTGKKEERYDGLVEIHPPIKHECLKTNQHDGSLNTTNEEDIIYIDDE